MKKKILALVLAVVMVVGLGVTGFAANTADGVVYGFSRTLANAPTVTGNDITAVATTGANANVTVTLNSGNLINPTQGAWGFTVNLNGMGADSVVGIQTVATPTSVDTFAVFPTAYSAWSGMTLTNGTPAALGTTTWDPNAQTLTFVGNTAFGYNVNTSINFNLVLAAPAITSRTPALNSATDIRNLTINVRGAVQGDASVTTSSSTSSSTTTASDVVLTSNVKATDFQPNMSLGYGYDGATGRSLTYGLGTIRPSDKTSIKLWLTSDMFYWGGTNVFTVDGNVVSYYLSSQVVRNSKISVRTQVATGSKAILSTEIKYDTSRAYARVKFVEEWVSTASLDFEFTTYLLIDGKRKDNSGEGVTFTGTLENYIILVYANDDYVDTSLGEVAEAVDFVPNIQVDLGNGVSIYTKFFKGKKYYGTATRDADEAAEVVFARYPDVDNVVILKTVGLNSTGDTVRLSTDYNDYYVYDKDLNYLGQSSDKLAYSSRYYLANRKLDVDDVDDVGEPEEYNEPSETGGDNGITNANANPGTGC